MKNFEITAYALIPNQPIQKIVCYSEDIQEALLIAVNLSAGFRSVEITDSEGLVHYRKSVSDLVFPEMEKTTFEAIDWVDFVVHKNREQKEK
jgi:hypothetical protein